MRRLRLAVLPAVLALALGACGDDEEQTAQNGQGGGGTTTTAPPPSQQQPGQQPGQQPAQQQEEEEVRAAVREYVEGLAGQNAPQVCDALTEQAQSLLRRDLNVESGQCEEVAREAAQFATGQAGQALRDAEALNVDIQGDRATVELSVAGTTVPIELEKAPDGEWQVSDANEEALRKALP